MKTTVDKSSHITTIAALFVIALAVFLMPLISVFIGAFSGWVVGLVFPNTMSVLTGLLGASVAPWQAGAILGFVGGFFRTIVPNKS